MNISNRFLGLPFVYLFSFYIFLIPLVNSFGFYFFKPIFLVASFSCFFMYLLFSIRPKLKKFAFFVYFFVFFMIPICIFVWSEYGELNLLLTPLLGFVLFYNKNDFLRVIKLIILVNLIVVCYEFVFSEYLFTSFTSGFIAQSDRVLDTKIYGDVGFRAKGIFSGPLDATSFVILSCIIFRHQKLILTVLLLTALLLNGRLCIIIAFTIYLGSYVSAGAGKGLLGSLITIFSVIFLAIVIVFSFIFVQSESAMINFVNLMDFNSGSNYYRLYYFLDGLNTFFNYDLNFFLFGNSGYFESVNVNSAESGFINQALNIGLFGFLFYFIWVLYLLFKSLILSQQFMFICILCLFASLIVFRVDAGFMRGSMLWFSIFLIRDELMYKKVVVK